MSKLIEMLRNASGRLSLARMACVITILLWWGTWLYTLFLGKSYAHFSECTLAMLAELFVILMGKAIDSKIISVKNENVGNNAVKAKGASV